MPSGVDPQDTLDEIPSWIQRAILLYNRCAMFGTELTLPCDGGILDQPESLMQILETIHVAVQEDRIRRYGDEQFAANQKLRVMQAKVQGSSTMRT